MQAINNSINKFREILEHSSVVGNLQRFVWVSRRNQRLRVVSDHSSGRLFLQVQFAHLFTRVTGELLFVLKIACHLLTLST